MSPKSLRLLIRWRWAKCISLLSLSCLSLHLSAIYICKFFWRLHQLLCVVVVGCFLLFQEIHGAKLLLAVVVSAMCSIQGVCCFGFVCGHVEDRFWDADELARRSSSLWLHSLKLLSSSFNFCFEQPYLKHSSLFFSYLHRCLACCPVLKMEQQLVYYSHFFIVMPDLAPLLWPLSIRLLWSQYC